MILVDTSVWIDHLRDSDEPLRNLLEDGKVLGHPFVTGELALGNLRNRNSVLRDLADLPQAPVAQHSEVFHFIEQNALFGLGLGYVDAHLLASVRLTPGATLLTRDKRLLAAAEHLRVAPGQLH